MIQICVVHSEEGNKLIAEFMGVHKYMKSNMWQMPNKGTIHLSQMRYHSSWDWLMPVLKKIDKLQPIENKLNEMEEWWDLIDNSVTQNYEIRDVFPFVVNFIAWFNSVQECDASKADSSNDDGNKINSEDSSLSKQLCSPLNHDYEIIGNGIKKCSICGKIQRII